VPSVFIGLGANLGDRKRTLSAAVVALNGSGLTVLGKSSLYETSAYGNTDQPAFLNAVVHCDTDLDPGEVLDRLKDIEIGLGRREREPWAPREVDLDLLFYEDRVLTGSELTLPHPDLHNRLFVLVPLAELEPDLVHPVLKKTVRELLDDLRSTDSHEKGGEIVKIIEKPDRF
jgi:2-amino-4-hydroxy-6-hydroxymethyldihydropteridine diphosphokinase